MWWSRTFHDVAPPRTIVISQTGRVRLEDGARASCDP